MQNSHNINTFFLSCIFLLPIFTEAAPRLIQSISCNVHDAMLCNCVIFFNEGLHPSKLALTWLLLSVSVYLGQFLSAFVHFSLFLFVIVGFCPLLSVSVCLCQFLSVSVFFCPFLSVSIHFCLFLLVSVRLCLFLSIFGDL